ncbi:MAG: AsmA family protein, partial [Alphaproteobacteria bacterium]|nr:AsmA family protein [Alphaproteobacteria bacterium]
MRISTLVKILAGLVVLVVAAVFVAILVIDPNEYKDEIIAAVEDQTGREFSIESDIDLNIGLTPSFAVSGVRIANANWSSRPDMMSVGEFAAEVALLPLIFGDLQINRLVLRDADILIETDAEGRSNLDFGGAEKEKSANEGTPNLPQINNVLVENAILTIVNGTTNATSKFEVTRLSAKAKDLSSPLAIDVTGIATIEEQAIEFAAEGDLGAPKLLLAATQPYPINLTVTGLGVTAKINGTIADLVEIAGLDLKFEVSGPNLLGLAPLAGDGLPTAGPITLAATIKGNSDNAALETIALQIGKTDVAGSLSIDMRGQRPRLEGTLHAGQVDITELLPSGENSKSTDGDKLFSSDPLPLGVLKSVDAKLDIAITQLILPGMTLADAKGVLALDNGALALKPLDASLVGSAVSGDIGVDTRSGPASVSFNVKAPQLDIGELLREFAGLDKLRGGGAVDVALRGTGSSVAEIMASLNGHSRLLMG